MSAQLVANYAEQIGNPDIKWNSNDDILFVNDIGLKIGFDNTIKSYKECDMLSNHLERLVNLNQFDEDNFICDLIILLNELVPNLYNKCTICGDHILSLDCIDTCGKLDCINKSLSLITNDYVCNFFHHDENVFNLLIYTAY
jgi:hypothetical protein